MRDSEPGDLGWEQEVAVRVWGLRELDLQQALQQQAALGALLAVDGEVWVGVGREVVVWGRRA